MDCEKFERVLLDHLYGELDELTRAGASRHADQCRRCKQLWLGLKATREVGALPLEEPRENFEARVMDAERHAQVGMPFAVRMSRKLTIVAGYAMRHELAMAALALLMIGSSLLLLRPRPGAHATSAPAAQEGAPIPEPEEVVIPVEEKPTEEQAEPEVVEPAALEPAAASQTGKHKPELAAPPSATAAESAVPPSSEEELDLARARAEDRAYASAMTAFRAADYMGAQQQFDAIVESGGRNAAAAELYAAISAEQGLGCAGAVPRFDSVAAKYPSADLGHMATWHSAVCRTQLGHDRRALLDFQKLLKIPSYAARARKALGLVGTESAADVSSDSVLTGSNEPVTAVATGADGASVAATPQPPSDLPRPSETSKASETSQGSERSPAGAPAALPGSGSSGSTPPGASGGTQRTAPPPSAGDKAKAAQHTKSKPQSNASPAAREPAAAARTAPQAPPPQKR